MTIKWSKIVAYMIGPVLCAIGFSIHPTFIIQTPEAVAYLFGFGIWCYSVGYIDHRNSEWVASL